MSSPSGLTEEAIETKQFINTTYMAQHSDSTNSDVCPFCQTFSFTYEPMLKHIGNAHYFEQKFTIKYAFREKRSDFKCVCKKCKKEFANDNEFAQHIYANHEKEFLTLIIKECRPEHKDRLYEFINKHNPGFVDIVLTLSKNGDSGSEEEDPEVLDNDEEYFSFIASSIRTTGVSAPPKKRISIDKLMVKPKEIEAEYSSGPTVEDLHTIEMLMKNGNFISVNDSYMHCKLCNTNFDSVIHLISHCHYQHKVVITPAMRNFLYLMSNDVTPDTPDDVILSNLKLHVEYSLVNTVQNFYRPRVIQKMTLPPFLGDLLVDLFACDAPVEDIMAFPKSSYNNEIVYFKLPSPIPAILSTVDGCLEMGFFNTPFITASMIYNQFDMVLTTLYQNNILLVKIINTYKFGFTNDELLDIATKHKVYFLRTKPTFDDALNTRNFKLYVYRPSWTPAIETEVKSDILKLFEKYEPKFCRRCRSTFDPNSPELCEGPTIGTLSLKMKAAPHELETKVKYASISCEAVSIESIVNEMSRQ